MAGYVVCVNRIVWNMDYPQCHPGSSQKGFVNPPCRQHCNTACPPYFACRWTVVDPLTTIQAWRPVSVKGTYFTVELQVVRNISFHKDSSQRFVNATCRLHQKTMAYALLLMEVPGTVPGFLGTVPPSSRLWTTSYIRYSCHHLHMDVLLDVCFDIILD
jgi:hypothetical protein